MTETAMTPMTPRVARSWQYWTVLLGGACLVNALGFMTLSAQPGVGELAAGVGALLMAAPLWLRAAKHVGTGRKRMDILVALAVLACFALSDYLTAGVVAFLMLAAVALEEHTASGAWTAVESLMKLAPKKARRMTADGAVEEVEAASLSVGDIVQVLPGDTIPVDGTIRSGGSAVSEATITGESIPVDKGAGDGVFAGTLNVSGALEITVDKVGEDTTLAKVRQLIVRARESKPAIAGVLEGYAGWYLPLVIMVAALVLFLTDDASRAISAIVAACPIALVIALPSATVAALACAYRQGILVKKPGDFELATTINAVVLDKTGTLTSGELRVGNVIPLGGREADDVLKTAASLAQLSRHPVSRALVAHATALGLSADDPRDVQETPGQGITGQVDGRTIRLGRPSFLADAGVDTAALESQLDRVAGFSVLALAVDNEAAGLFALADTVRPEARAAVASLRSLGVTQIIMVTGDRQAVADRIGEALAVDRVVAECLPDQKLALVKSLRAEGYRVLVVGDGVNDAPALASGDIGAAFGRGGSEIAVESAGVALMRDDLNGLSALLKLGRRNRTVMTQNLLIGVALIVSGIFLAGFGYLTPISAAFLQNAGALGVLFSSARLVSERTRTGGGSHGNRGGSHGNRS